MSDFFNRDNDKQECAVEVNGGQLYFMVSTRETTKGHEGVVTIGGVEVFATAIGFERPDDAYSFARRHVIRKFAELTR